MMEFKFGLGNDNWSKMKDSLCLWSFFRVFLLFVVANIYTLQEERFVRSIFLLTGPNNVKEKRGGEREKTKVNISFFLLIFIFE